MMALLGSVACSRVSRHGATGRLYDPSEAVAVTCSFSERGRTSLAIAGRPVYVAAEAFSVSAGDALIAGVPNYVWRLKPDGKPDEHDAVADSLFGVVVGPAGRVRGVVRPITARFANPVAIARPGGGWQIVFSELDGQPWPNQQSVAIWYGEYDGLHWTRLQQLALPDGYTLTRVSRPVLARSGDMTAVAVIANPPTGTLYEQILLFESAAAGWQVNVVSVPHPKRQPHPAWVSSAYLGPGRPSGFTLLARRFDIDMRDNPAEYGSFFEYTRNGGWHERKVVPAVKWSRTEQFVYVNDSNTEIMSWVTGPQVVAYYRHGNQSEFRDAIIEQTSTRINIALLMLGDGRPLWITQRWLGAELKVLPRSEIRFHTMRRDSAMFVGARESPFLQFQAAARSNASEILLVGPHAPTDPADSSFATLLMRVRTRCEYSDRPARNPSGR